jgi:exopolyphosphatase / guanosine-5'-triphosphate,3'-diphosphate pyrophosphatase
MKRVAVIDVGSNSIKCLVARRHPGGGVFSIYENTLAVRISAGINADRPVLSHAALDAGTEAIGQLLAECERKGPLAETVIVATSAVRDALNGEDFARLVYDRSGIPLTILSGEDEARLIGRGILEDPALHDLAPSFCVADVGGGSLELIQVINGEVGLSTSLQLGAVRLTERFITDPKGPILATESLALERYVGEALQATAFPLGAPVVGTGGTITVWRSMLAQARGVTVQEISPDLPRADLRQWLERFRHLSWEERCAIPGLPKPRADVTPAGFSIVEAILASAGADTLHHSRYNLRYGVSAETLEQLG